MLGGKVRNWDDIKVDLRFDVFIVSTVLVCLRMRSSGGVL